MANRVDVAPPINREMTCLAPVFRQNVSVSIAECNAEGWDAIVHETCRSNALQEYYYEHGASKAASIEHSWHGYGLAVDVISRQHGWDLYGRSIPTAFELNVSRIFKLHGIKWGGDWISFKDYPHFQHGLCKASPSEVAIQIMQSAGVEAVWRAVRAI